MSSNNTRIKITKWEEVPISTRKSLFFSEKNQKVRWEILKSLEKEGDEWAENVIAASFVISVNLDDGLFPESFDYGIDIAKNVALRATDLDVSQISLSNIYTPYPREWNYTLADLIVVLFGFGHICLKLKIEDDEDEMLFSDNYMLGGLYYESFRVAMYIKRRIDELGEEISGEYLNNIFLSDYHYFWDKQFDEESRSGSFDSKVFCKYPKGRSLNEADKLRNLNGEFTVKSLDEYRRTCSYYKDTISYLGDTEAMFSLAKVYYSGLGIAPKNIQSAKYWLKKAIDADIIEAVQFLEEHPDLKDSVKNISYHVDGDIIQDNKGIIAKGNAVVNRANLGEYLCSSNTQEYKFCIFCGEKLPKKAKFCSSCGAKQE